MTRHKQLLVGSGPYLREWWRKNKEAFSDVNCINNSIDVVGDRHLRWYVSEDFFHHRNWVMPEVLRKKAAVRMTTSMLTTPHGYHCPYNGTMLVNAIYDILNRATVAGKPVELSLIGCDLDYSKPKTHFYPGGTADPRRIPDEILLGHLHKVEKDFSPMHKVVNLGLQPSFLPFEPGDPDLSWST